MMKYTFDKAAFLENDYVFDLDNTLYNEIDFILPIFKATCSELCSELTDHLCSLFQQEYYLLGNNKLIDRVIPNDAILKSRFLKAYKSKLRGNVSLMHKINVLPKFEMFLRSGYFANRPLIVITNGNPLQQKYKIELLNLRNKVDKFYVFFANEIEPKPNKRVWDVVKERVDIPDPVYVGDSVVDLEFARNAGIRFLHQERFYSVLGKGES